MSTIWIRIVLILISLSFHQFLFANSKSLVELTTNELTSLKDVLVHFDELEDHYAIHQDRRKLFVLIYRKTTLNILNRVVRDEVDDGDWLIRTIIGFADEYRKAVYNYEIKNYSKTPLPWKFDFDKSKDHSLGLATQLLLSMNSHILHDLPIVMAKDAGADYVLKTHERDYFELNDMFMEILPKFLDIVYKEANQRPAFYFNPVEALKRKVMGEIVIAMRQTAWDRARKLLSFSSKTNKDAYVQQINEHVLKMSELAIDLDPFLSLPPGSFLPRHLFESTWTAISKIYKALDIPAPPTELETMFKQLSQQSPN